MYTGTHVKDQLFLPDFNEIWIFEKSTNIKFYENLSSGTELLLADGRTDTAKRTRLERIQFSDQNYNTLFD